MTAALGRILCALAVLASGLIAPAQTEGPDKIREAGILVDRNEFRQALALYQDVLDGGAASEPKTKSRLLNNMGYCQFKLGRWDKASEFYRSALELDPNYAVCLNNMAALLMNQEKYQDALPYLDRAYGLERKIKIVFNLFVCHANLKHEKEAKEYIRESFDLDEKYTTERLKSKNVSAKDIERLKKEIKAKG